MSSGDAHDARGIPNFAVKVDGRTIASRRDSLDETLRFGWETSAPAHGTVTVEVDADFPWAEDVCVVPEHQIQWRAADDTVFDVSSATREMEFRFDPIVSFMAVNSWSDSAVFERGTVFWHWNGASRPEFSLEFASGYADEHTGLFPGRYHLPKDKGLDDDYFEIFSLNCEESDLSMDEGNDTLSTDAHVWVEDARNECRSVIITLSQLHGLAPPDTTSTGAEPPLDQAGLTDTALSELNPVERRNIRYAVALMWALDPKQSAGAILARADRVHPQH